MEALVLKLEKDSELITMSLNDDPKISGNLLHNFKSQSIAILPDTDF
jgi:hypothetical protein